MSSQKLTLYTNHGCPWAHRAHIALAELGLSFDEVIIDLQTPREEWYLKINPRGLVPALRVGDEIIVESGIIVQYLVDSQASTTLLPSPGTPEAALKRARINFFVDTFVSKIVPLFYGAYFKPTTEEERAEKSASIIKTVEGDLIPLLEDAAPFFGGSKDLTLAEVNTSTHLLRFYSTTKAGLFPTSWIDTLSKHAAWEKWIKAVFAKESVTAIYDENKFIENVKKRRAALEAAKKDA